MSDLQLKEPTTEAGYTKARKRRNSKRVSSDPLQRYLDDYATSANQVDLALGLSHGMSRRWLNDGLMPEWMRWCIEGMRRKENRDKILIVKPGPKLDVVKDTLKAMGVSCQEL